MPTFCCLSRLSREAYLSATFHTHERQAQAYLLLPLWVVLGSLFVSNISHTEAYLLLPLWVVLGGLFVCNLRQLVHDTLQPSLHSVHIGLVQ